MFQDTHMRMIAKLVGVAAILALLTYTYYAYVQARNLDNYPVSISVTGKGEVFAKPDIATFSFSVEAKEADATAAQNGVASTMKKITDYLASSGVEEKDVKTDWYNLQPWYEYPEVRCTSFGCPPMGEPILKGYQVMQSVSVKVRTTEDAGKIISGVGELGAQNVSGLAFTIDDEDALKAEARTLAIDDARAKADELAKKLGVRIVRMTGYYEDQGPMPYYGMGGGIAMDMAMTKEAAVPAVLPQGENQIISNVNISYEVR